MASYRDRKKETPRSSPEMQKKIRDSVQSVVEFAIKNYGGEKFDSLDAFKEVAGWYGDSAEGKMDHSQAMAAVSNHIVESLIEKIAGYLQTALIGGLGIKLGNSKEKMIEKMELSTDFEYEMEIAKELETKVLASCKIAFRITGAGKLEGLKIHRTFDGMDIEISKCSVPLTVSIAKLRLEVASLPISKELPKSIPIIEGHMLQFENYLFSFG